MNLLSANALRAQPLYARPPPIWGHPAFVAEFGDAFIGGTGLEGGSIHTSLEVGRSSPLAPWDGVGCAAERDLSFQHNGISFF